MFIFSSSSRSNKVTSGLVCVSLVLILVLTDDVDGLPISADDKVSCPVCDKDYTRRGMALHMHRVHPDYEFSNADIARLKSIVIKIPGRLLNSEEMRQLKGDPSTTKRRGLFDKEDDDDTQRLSIPPGKQYLHQYARARRIGFVSEEYMRKKEAKKREFLELQKVWEKKLRQSKVKRPKLDDGFDEIDETFRNSLNEKETTTRFDAKRIREDDILPMRKMSLQNFAASQRTQNEIYRAPELTPQPIATQAPIVPDPIVTAPPPPQSLRSYARETAPRPGSNKVACPYCGGMYVPRGMKKHMKSAHPGAAAPLRRGLNKHMKSAQPAGPPPLTVAMRRIPSPPPKQLDLCYRFLHKINDNKEGAAALNGTQQKVVPSYSKYKLRSSIDRLIKMMSRDHKKLESAMVRGRLLNHPFYKSARRIGIYVSKDDEVDTRQLIEDICNDRLRKECYTPWYQNLFGPNLRMLRIFHIEDLRMYKKTREGVLVAEKPWLTRDALRTEGGLDLIVVPGRVFTLEGKRLGRYGDLFDEFLHGLKAMSPHCKIIGLAFGKQIVDDFTINDILELDDPPPVCMDDVLYDLNFKRLAEMNGRTPMAPPLSLDGNGNEPGDHAFYNDADYDDRAAVASRVPAHQQKSRGYSVMQAAAQEYRRDRYQDHQQQHYAPKAKDLRPLNHDDIVKHQEDYFRNHAHRFNNPNNRNKPRLN